MSLRVRSFAAALLVAVSALELFAAKTAHAQFGGPPPGMPPDNSDDIPEREGDPKPYADDLRTGHVYIDAFGSAVFPTGNVAPNRRFEEVLTYGFTVGGKLGVGIGRDAELDAVGTYGLLTGPTDCETCAGAIATASIGIVYHLVQGASIDPWIRFGVGYRMTEIEHGENEADRVLAIATGTYHAVDIAQVSLGARFFPVRGFGFGPWFEADAGTMVAWADGSTRGTRPYGFFMLGLELILDPVSFVKPSAASAPTPAEQPTTTTVAGSTAARF